MLNVTVFTNTPPLCHIMLRYGVCRVIYHTPTRDMSSTHTPSRYTSSTRHASSTRHRLRLRQGIRNVTPCNILSLQEGNHPDPSVICRFLGSLITRSHLHCCCRLELYHTDVRLKLSNSSLSVFFQLFVCLKAICLGLTIPQLIFTKALASEGELSELAIRLSCGTYFWLFYLLFSTNGGAPHYLKSRKQ